MAVPIVTREQVFAFCDELQADGDRPTITLLYPKFNNRGGYSTISKYLKEWKEEHKGAQIPALPQELPEDIVKPVEYALRRVMAKLDNRASERIAEIVRRSADDIKNVADDLAVATSEITRLEELEADYKSKLDGLTEELERTRLTIATDIERIRQLEDRLKDERTRAEKNRQDAAGQLEAQRLKTENLIKNVTSIEARLTAVEEERDRLAKLLETMGKKDNL